MTTRQRRRFARQYLWDALAVSASLAGEHCPRCVERDLRENLEAVRVALKLSPKPKRGQR
jgi:hypothetical protein